MQGGHLPCTRFIGSLEGCQVFCLFHAAYAWGPALWIQDLLLKSGLFLGRNCFPSPSGQNISFAGTCFKSSNRI